LKESGIGKGIDLYTASLINAIHDVHARLASEIPFRILAYNSEETLGSVDIYANQIEIDAT
jgi:hypothetical protein